MNFSLGCKLEILEGFQELGGGPNGFGFIEEL
jgi:hypothetical protein